MNIIIIFIQYFANDIIIIAVQINVCHKSKVEFLDIKNSNFRFTVNGCSNDVVDIWYHYIEHSKRILIICMVIKWMILDDGQWQLIVVSNNGQ